MSKIKSLMLRTAGFAIVGSLAIAGQAQAQTVDVNFAGNVASTCTFGAPTAGVLEQAFSGADPVMAVEGVKAGIPFGVNGGGTAGSVTLNCSNGGSLSAAAPVGTAPNGFTPATLQSVVYANDAYTGNAIGTKIWSSVDNTPITLPSGVQTINVGMIVGSTTPGVAPTGTYNYKVTLTATPQ